MSEACKVLAAVTVEGLEAFGQSPATGVYVCTAAGMYTGPAAPIVCGAAGVATSVGVWATTPAGKELMTMAAEKSCEVVVQGGNLLLVKGGEAADSFKKTAKEAGETYNALNTAQGISWLMRRLSGM